MTILMTHKHFGEKKIILAREKNIAKSMQYIVFSLKSLTLI